MKRINTFLAVAFALLVTTATANAQEEAFKPYAFIGIQGGGQTTLTDYNNWKLITPTASVSVGVQFTPAFGARMHVNGLWNKGGFYGYGVDDTFKFNYATADLDAMINIVNLITRKDYNPVDVYLIGGFGFNYAWDNEDKPALRQFIPAGNSRNRQSHNVRVGAMLDVNVAPHWSVNVEFAANNLNDRYNSRLSGSDDWQFTAQLGVTYKFHIRQKVKGTKRDSDSSIGSPDTDAIDSETLPANTNVGLSKTEPEPEPAQPAVAVPQSITRNIFFALRSTEIAAKEQGKLAEVATWLKEHPAAKVTVTGYADRGTGTAAINARYAEQRAESVTKELKKKYGIDASRIKTESKGDTIQPFPNDNDQNRVTIVIAEE